MPILNREKIYQRMLQKERETLDTLEELSLPGWTEYMQTVQSAPDYIKKVQLEYTEALVQVDEPGFNRALEKYCKALHRIWELMAIEHCKSREFGDVDQRYYRHMPDGNSFVMDSKVLGRKIRVYPRPPKKPPKDMVWMTSTELIMMNEYPIIFEFLKTFEGSWYDRTDDNRLMSAIEKAMAEDKKNIKPVLQYAGTDKHGFDVYKVPGDRKTVRRTNKTVDKEEGSEELLLEDQ